MSAIDLETILHLGALLGLAGLVLGRKWYQGRFQRALRRATPTPIAEVADGVAKVIGRASPAGPLVIAPWSRRACIAYSIVVADRVGPEWLVRHESTDCADFFVTDESGVAFVEGQHAQLGLRVSANRAAGLGSPDGEAWLATLPTTAGSGLFARVLVVEEGVLLPDDPVAVLGPARHRVDPEPKHVNTYRETPTRLVFATQYGVGLVVGHPQ